MNCPNCGAPAKEGALFCKSCGTRLVEQPTLEFVTPDLEQCTPSAEQGATAPAQMGGGEFQATADDRRAEREAKRQANAQVKEAKAAYKSARKAAGKSAAPKVIGVVVAIVVAAGAGAAAMWRFGPAPSAGSSSSSQASLTADVSSSANAQVSDSTSAASGSSVSSGSASSDGVSSSEESVVAKNYLGTWSGDLVETSSSNAGRYKCYGARDHQLVLDIVEFESTGRVSANATVLVHAHDPSYLDRDVDFHGGDQAVTLTKLTGTYKNGSISFKGDTSKGIEVNISVETDDSSGSQRHLLVTVDANGFNDVYKLSRES